MWLTQEPFVVLAVKRNNLIKQANIDFITAGQQRVVIELIFKRPRKSMDYVQGKALTVKEIS